MVPGLTRRRFLKSTGAIGLGASLGCAAPPVAKLTLVTSSTYTRVC